MQVRTLSKKQSGGTTTSGLMDIERAKKVIQLLKKQYPNDRHTIVRSDGTAVRRNSN